MPVYDEKRAKFLDGYLGEHEDPLTGFSRHTDEFTFIADYAKCTGGPILELACGAGRIMRALARLGYEVYGIDASRPMLNRGMQAKQELPKEVQDRIHFIQSDMRSFKLKTVFPFIIIPFNSFWYNLNERGAVDCLQSIMSHLAYGGFFFIDSATLYSPNNLLFFHSYSKRLGFDFTTPVYSGSSPRCLVGRHSNSVGDLRKD